MAVKLEEPAMDTKVDLELSNSLKNKVKNNDKAFHDWYRFVLSYPPHLVRQYLTEFRLSSNHVVLDPFCGTGTTLVESKIRGINSLGIEANPFAYFASNVKTDWDVNPHRLCEVALDIKAAVEIKLRNEGISDYPSESNKLPKSYRRLRTEQQKLMLSGSISPMPLHKCLHLKDEIERYAGSTYHKYLRLALAKIALFEASNLRFGPEVGVGSKKKDASVINKWFNQVLRCAQDLEESLGYETRAISRTIQADARSINKVVRSGTVSAVITSPPYPNEKDYTRATRLESVLLDFIKDRTELKFFKKQLIRSNTRNVYKGDDDDAYIKDNQQIIELANEIERKRILLQKDSGFEKLYHKVTTLYFGGMARHLHDLKPTLKPGAKLAYVVGDQASFFKIMIRTGQLLVDVAKSQGFEHIRTDLFRTRFSTATKSELNEEVVLLSWKG